MLSCTVGDVLDATGARLALGDEGQALSGVSTDSRSVGQGSLFVCFPGERVDGNDFAAAALESGAAAVVMTREPDEGVLAAARTFDGSVLVTPDADPEELMLSLAGFWRARNPQWVVVGVTGSVGKTTTKDMLAAGLATRWRVHATAGNFNNLIGLPLTLLSASPSDEVVVAEMGMNHAGELERLSRCARPDLALITNVGTSHIGLLGSRENIARAKAEILSGMVASDSVGRGRPRPCLVLAADNDFASLIEGEFARPAGVDVVYVGSSPSCLASSRSLELDDQGHPHFTLAFSDGWAQEVCLDVPGRHVVQDFLLAMAIADRLCTDRASAAAAIARMPRTRMRLEVVSAPGKPRMIDDSYNASPNSVAAALDVLESMECAGRRVAVLGEVGELGAESARLHGYMGAYAAGKPLDLLVLVGEGDISHTEEAARTMGFSEDKLERVADAAQALELIAPVLREDDLVLVKASRAAGLDAFVKGVLAR